ncbi:MAG: 16S rRNA processing protein RimM [Myxococcales bacterium]|nr:16S rRNA processing protein RimM [Myxococcales bacterium]
MKRDELNLAKIGRPHGIHGWVRVFPHNPASTLADKLTSVRLVFEDGAERSMQVAGWRETATSWLMKFESIDDRDQAATLTHADLYVPWGLLEPLEDDQFYYEEVLGWQVVDETGCEIGRIASVFVTSTDVFEVVGPRGRYLIPAVDEFVDALDAHACVLRVKNLADELRDD